MNSGSSGVNDSAPSAVTARPGCLVVPVVLLCAASDEVTVRSLFPLLREAGLEPSLVSGVDLDPNGIVDVIDHEPAGLFVVCRSSRIDPFHERRLHGLFGARAGQHQRLIVELFDPRRPEQLVVALRAAAQTYVGGDRVDATAARSSASTRREIIGIIPARIRLPRIDSSARRPRS